MRSLIKSFAAFVFLQLAFAGAASALNQAPVATMTAPATGSQFNAPTSITLSATASDPDGSVAKVEFYSGTTLLGPGVTAAPYAFTWNNVAAGTYSITAKAYDNLGKTGTSAAVQIKVINPTTVITSPAAGAVVGRAVAVNGTYTGDDATVVIVTAGAGHSTVASSSAQSFSAGVPLSRGANTIEVQVARADGTFEIVDRSVTAVDPPVVVMTAPASDGPYTAPAQLTLVADAASAQGTIAKVEFFENSISSGVQTLGVATAPPYSVVVTLAADFHHIFARATDSFGFTSDSQQLGFIVQSQPPTVQITAPAANTTFTAPANIGLTATASDPDGTITRVDYFANGGFIGVTTSAPYALSWPNVAVGNYAITARATDNTGVTTDSAPVNVTVSNNALPTVTLDAPSGSVSYRAPANISFSATASDPDGTVSKVEFLLNDVVVATATTAPYAQAATGIAAGTYVAKARATDNNGGVTTSSVTASVAVAADALPTITITSPASGAAFSTPATVAISANATDSDGTISKVEFFADSILLGATTTAPYGFNWTNAPLGSHVLTAKATDNDGGTTTSAPVMISVAGITAGITSPADGATYAAPVGFTIQATAATSSGNITSVDFFDGATLLQTISIPTGFSTVNVSETLPDVAAGIHSYTVKGHDDGGRVGTSTAVTVTVTAPPAPPGVNLTAPESGSFFIAPVTIVLSADATSGSNPVARVEFYNGSTLFGTAMSAPYSMSWTNVSVGNYSLTAKAFDTSGNESTSIAAQIEVSSAPSVTIDSGFDGSTVNDDHAMVTGAIRSTPNSSVMVNGVPAEVDLAGKFVANGIPLAIGTNTLNVAVATIDGQTAATSITITRGASDPVGFHAEPLGGIAPLDVGFVIENRGGLAIKKVELDPTGSGPLQDITAGIGNIIRAQFTEAGTYFPRLVVTDMQDVQYISTLGVVVVSAEALSGMLKGQLNTMLQRLQSAQIDLALNALTGAIYPKYQDIFGSLQQGGVLGQAAQQFGSVQEGTFQNTFAEFLLVRDMPDGTQAGFGLYFIKGEDGIWRIDGM